MPRYSKTKPKIDWAGAPDIQKALTTLIESLQFDNFDTSRIFCYRSTNAATRAYARIWGLSRVWQKALDQKPAYILEVISEKFDKLSDREKIRVLMHELAHIPMNFSGALMPHRHGKGGFHDKLKKMIAAYERNR